MRRRKRKILVVTGSLRTGSWVCVKEMIENLKNDFRLLVVGSGSMDKGNLPFPVIRIPYPNHGGRLTRVMYRNGLLILLFKKII